MIDPKVEKLRGEQVMNDGCKFDWRIVDVEVLEEFNDKYGGMTVRVYLGKLGFASAAWGDDWDDHFIDMNAGVVYPEYFEHVVDVSFFRAVKCAAITYDWFGNGRWTRKDAVRGMVPLMVLDLDPGGTLPRDFLDILCVRGSMSIYHGQPFDALFESYGDWADYTYVEKGWWSK